MVDSFNYYLLLEKKFKDFNGYFQAGLQNLVGKIIPLNSMYKRIVIAVDSKDY
jgi:hypothetical protein